MWAMEVDGLEEESAPASTPRRGVATPSPLLVTKPGHDGGAGATSWHSARRRALAEASLEAAESAEPEPAADPAQPAVAATSAPGSDEDFEF
jgi:hypothetical protein